MTRDQATNESCEGQSKQQITRCAECLRGALQTREQFKRNMNVSVHAHVPVRTPVIYHITESDGESQCFLGGLVGQDRFVTSTEQLQAEGPRRSGSRSPEVPG